MSVPEGISAIGTPAKPSGVHVTDRLWDLAALVFVIGGISLFVFARRALITLGSGTYHVPKGVSYVARTDLHVAQTRMAIWLIGLGVLLGVVSAVRHRMRGEG